MNDGKRILLYPAGVPQREAFLEAKQQGLYIITVDRNPDSPCFELADEHHQVDPGAEAEFVAFVRELHAAQPLNGMLLVASDIPVPFATAAQICGLPAISPQAAALTVDKLRSKQVMRAAEVLVPDFWDIDNLDQLVSIVNEHGGRFIIKPNDNSAARGITILDEASDLAAAYEHALNNVKRHGVILERFEGGVQISIEGLEQDGTIHVTGFADRNYEMLERYAPYVIENGATIPTELTDADRAAVEAEFTKACRALGITNSVAKGDMILGPDGAKVIEVAGRISGGKFASRLVPEATGVNLLRAAIKLAMGHALDPDWAIPDRNRGVAVRYLFPEPGVVARVRGVEGALEMSGILEAVTTFQPSETIPPITNHADRGGWVVAKGETREQAVLRAEAAINNVVYEYQR